jgi:predicted RNase H-like HicB family nuclease
MLQVNLPVSILREGKQFIAYTPALDLSTSGKTYEEVRRRFREIVEIFLEEVTKKSAIPEIRSPYQRE